MGESFHGFPTALLQVADPEDISDETANWSFGNARTPNTNRPTLVIMETEAVASGGSTGEIEFSIDKTGDGTVDHTLQNSVNAAGLASNPNAFQQIPATVLLPPGGSITIVNSQDPNGQNNIDMVLEATL